MTAASVHRYDSIDVMRGFAILLMVIYHFCFDLSYFELADFDFYNSLQWQSFRVVIVSQFLFLVGFSLSLAAHGGMNWSAYLRRLGSLLLCALIVSVVSYVAFGARWIVFGILHFIALASVIALLFLRLYRSNLVLGAGLIVLGVNYQSALFDTPLLQWLGMMTHKPNTEDYVPLLPWFGVVLIGLYAGSRFVRTGHPALLRAPVGTFPAGWLALAGRHGLLVYMLHQPLLLGLLWLVLQISPQ